MLSSLLRSQRAVEVTIAPMRTSVKLRRLMNLNRDLARRIEAMETRYDKQFSQVFDAVKSASQKTTRARPSRLSPSFEAYRPATTFSPDHRGQATQPQDRRDPHARRGHAQQHPHGGVPVGAGQGGRGPEIDAEAWAALNSDNSRAYDKPRCGRIAVKVINHLGNVVMKVFKV